MRFFMTFEWTYGLTLDSSAILTFCNDVTSKLDGKGYGSALNRIGIIIICRGFDLKQRIRLSKADLILRYDVILDYKNMLTLDIRESKEVVKEELIKNTDMVLGKYKLVGFDREKFLDEFKAAIQAAIWD